MWLWSHVHPSFSGRPSPSEGGRKTVRFWIRGRRALHRAGQHLFCWPSGAHDGRAPLIPCGELLRCQDPGPRHSFRARPDQRNPRRSMHHSEGDGHARLPERRIPQPRRTPLPWGTMALRHIPARGFLLEARIDRELVRGSAHSEGPAASLTPNSGFSDSLKTRRSDPSQWHPFL